MTITKEKSLALADWLDAAADLPQTEASAEMYRMAAKIVRDHAECKAVTKP